MTNSILLQNVSPEALTELIKEGVKSQLEDFKKELNFQNAGLSATSSETDSKRNLWLYSGRFQWAHAFCRNS